jgi:hypothetical protein
VPPYNFFGGSSSTSGCNLDDDLGRIEEQSNIDGGSSVDTTVMELVMITMIKMMVVCIIGVK